MPLQIWGTFSVSDHLAPRPFVADVLLYDRLVVPVPGDDVDRWQENRWEPAKQASLLDVLAEGDLVRQVVWDAGVRDDFERAWEQERKRAEGGERAEGAYRRGLATMANPMAATRGALFMEAEEKRDREFFAGHPDVVVESVAAYPSFERFDRASQRAPQPVPRRSALGSGAPDAPELSSVFGWEFFVPEDDARNDVDLLADAVELARKPSFRTARAEFHETRAQLYARGGSSRTLWADMEKRLDRYRDECRASNLKTRSAYAFWLAGAGAALAGLLLPPAIPIIGGVMFGGAGFLADHTAGGEHDSYSRPAALVHDARRHFGWKS